MWRSSAYYRFLLAKRLGRRSLPAPPAADSLSIVCLGLLPARGCGGHAWVLGPLSPGCAPMNVAGRRMLVVDEAPEVYPGTVAYEDHAGHMLERGGCLRAPPLPCAGRRIQRSCMLRKLKICPVLSCEDARGPIFIDVRSICMPKWSSGAPRAARRSPGSPGTEPGVARDAPAFPPRTSRELPRVPRGPVGHDFGEQFWGMLGAWTRDHRFSGNHCFPVGKS